MIVGLGNPGKEYEGTRHNIGFMILDDFAKDNNLNFKLSTKLNGLIAKSGDYFLLKPTTFMNNSGLAVKKVCDYYQIPISNVLIVSDDLDLPFGKIRLREHGSSGGHNGLKSIIANIGTDQFKRMRVGIGEAKKDTIDYVLGELSKEEKNIFIETKVKACQIIEDFTKDVSYNIIMTKYN